MIVVVLLMIHVVYVHQAQLHVPAVTDKEHALKVQCHKSPFNDLKFNDLSLQIGSWSPPLSLRVGTLKLPCFSMNVDLRSIGAPHMGNPERVKRRTAQGWRMPKYFPQYFQVLWDFRTISTLAWAQPCTLHPDQCVGTCHCRPSMARRTSLDLTISGRRRKAAELCNEWKPSTCLSATALRPAV